MSQTSQPLAAKMRPASIEDFIGQRHLLGPGTPLNHAIKHGCLHSMILWGPPGTGKTSLARLLAKTCQAHVESISAVLSGVKDIRLAIERAEQRLAGSGMQTVLFVDEVHRFNKSQQDAFLPFVEEGVVTFIGATTENPSFQLNNALLSRAKVYVLQALSHSELITLIKRAFKQNQCEINQPLMAKIAQSADGDGRRCLNLVSLVLTMAQANDGVVTAGMLDEVLTGEVRAFDNQGDSFYQQLSALQKSIRGSSADGALYWMQRLLDGGAPAESILRRLLVIASEDIGNADPRALQITLNAWDAYQRLGRPEGDYAIAQAVSYLAIAAKSNAVYLAVKSVRKVVCETGTLPVPMHLCNAPTKLLKDIGAAKGYRYAHDEPYGYAAGETYLPTAICQQRYYYPTDRGLEKKNRSKNCLFAAA